jgi:uncharacterized protein (TIGR02145 family)
MMKKIIRLNNLSVSMSILFITTCLNHVNGQESIKDYDGNIYHTVTIGTQVVMAENLKTKHYSDGETIPEIKDDSTWINLTTGAYCSNSNDESISSKYGYLYNWYVVSNQHKVCPVGWHVPSANEWKKLEIYLGGAGGAGGKMKETGTGNWSDPNAKADNTSGFSAIPGGSRNNDGTFNLPGETGMWWTSTEFSITTAWHRRLYNNVGFIDNIYANKNEGFSIRCVRDN